MCERYSFTLSKEKTARRFGIKVTQVPPPHYNIAPGTQVTAITQALPSVLSFLQWGIQLPKASNKNASKQVSTIDVASIQKQPLLQDFISNGRCMVPADAFYLWKKVSKKGKVPYRVSLKWNLPFAMAGIYKSDEQNNTGLAIITVPANTLLTPVAQQMPAILSLEHEKAWLNPELPLEDVFKMLLPYPLSTMKVHPVSAQLLNSNTNSDLLTKPAQPTDQFGNYILFGDI